MKRIFQQRGYFEVPDGTEVSPFLNATDANQTDVPWGLIGEMSIAAGRIGPGVQSWVHVHPVITQVTYVVFGDLAIRMKDPSTTDPYDLELRPGQAVVTEPGTLFQLRNMSNAPAEVLYIVSPAYVFEMEGGEVAYDDAIMVAKSWEELEAKKYEVPALRRRAEALRRLATRKGE